MSDLKKMKCKECGHHGKQHVGIPIEMADFKMRGRCVLCPCRVFNPDTRKKSKDPKAVDDK